MPELLDKRLDPAEQDFLKTKQLSYRVSGSNSESEDGKQIKRTWARIYAPGSTPNNPRPITPKIYADGVDRGSRVRALQLAVAEARGVWGDRELPRDVIEASDTIAELQKQNKELVDQLTAMQKQVEDKALVGGRTGGKAK